MPFFWVYVKGKGVLHELRADNEQHGCKETENVLLSSNESGS